MKNHSDSSKHDHADFERDDLWQLLGKSPMPPANHNFVNATLNQVLNDHTEKANQHHHCSPFSKPAKRPLIAACAGLGIAACIALVAHFYSIAPQPTGNNLGQTAPTSQQIDPPQPQLTKWNEEMDQLVYRDELLSIASNSSQLEEEDLFELLVF